MRPFLLRAWAALALLLAAVPVHASSPVSILLGPSRDGGLHDLQRKVDKLIGFGKLDVSRDYIGAHAGDPDPWFWVNRGTRDVVVQMVDRKSRRTILGWCDETTGRPVINGIDDGIVFNDWRVRRSRAVVRLPSHVTHFGFYVDTDQDDDDESNERGHYRYFTNRQFNDRGLRGLGATHAPFDGDMQFLIYDLSPWLGDNTWLVACEYSDSGRHVGFDRGDSDNDYADVVFLVSGLGATPTKTLSFARVKAMFR